MKFLVIGTGSIGKRHTRNLLATGVPATDIAAIDPREDRREEVRALGVETTYTSLAEALDSGSFDAAFVCSPTSMHIEDATALAERGVHMCIEKPLARDLEGIDGLQRAVEDNGVVVLMGYIFRFLPLTAKVRELLDADAIGKVLYARGEFSEYLPDWHPYEDYRSFYMAKKELGGGSILDQCHIMDLVHYLLGGFHSVFAVNTKVSSLEVEADDIAEMVIHLKSGVLASIHTDIFGREHRKQFEIKGETGNITWDFYANTVTLYDPDSKSVAAFKKFPTDFNLTYLEETSNFIASCRGEAKPLASLADGIETMQLIQAAERSRESGKVEIISG